MITVSIDMSNDDASAGHSIFGEVVEIQDNTLLCEYSGANYNFDNKGKLMELEAKLNIATKALNEVIEVVKRGFINCPACGYSPDCKGCWCEDVAKKALNKIKGAE